LSLQAKVALGLLKFELLLSASQEFRKQVLSSSEEGIPLERIQSGVAGGNAPLTAKGVL
jgi:hypothetical protein